MYENSFIKIIRIPIKKTIVENLVIKIVNSIMELDDLDRYKTLNNLLVFLHKRNVQKKLPICKRPLIMVTHLAPHT